MFRYFDTAFVLVDPVNHDFLLKFVKTKVTGEEGLDQCYS